MSERNKSICLIGGGGFIGKALRKYLATAGYDTLIIGRSLNIPLAVNERYFSIAEYSFKQLEELFKANVPAAIIDLAYSSVPNTSYDDPVKDFTENLYSIIRHLEFASSLGTEIYLYVSSGGTVYGDRPDALPIPEDAPIFPLSPYGITKLACERYVYMYYKTHALPALIVRPSNIYGPGQLPFRGQGLAATALGLAIKNEPIHIFGSGSNIRDYLYIDDFCKGVTDLINKGHAGEIYNMGYGAGYTITELISYVESTIAKDDLKLKRILHPERPFDVHYNVLDIKKMTARTGWEPEIDLANGIQKTWEWIRKYMNDSTVA